MPGWPGYDLPPDFSRDLGPDPQPAPVFTPQSQTERATQPPHYICRSPYQSPWCRQTYFDERLRFPRPKSGYLGADWLSSDQATVPGSGWDYTDYLRTGALILGGVAVVGVGLYAGYRYYNRQRQPPDPNAGGLELQPMASEISQV